MKDSGPDKLPFYTGISLRKESCHPQSGLSQPIMGRASYSIAQLQLSYVLTRAHLKEDVYMHKLCAAHFHF